MEEAIAAERRLERILRRPELERFTGLPRSTIYDKIAKGEFPRPIQLSSRAVGWIESEVLHWQQARLAARGRARQPESGLQEAK